MAPQMPPQTVTDYERRRLENIRRNGEMISSLLLRAKASSLLQTRKSKPKPKPKPEPRSPVVLRCSSRTRGIAPATTVQVPPPPPPPPLRMRDHYLIGDTFCGPDGSDSDFLASIRPAERAGSVEAGGLDPRTELVLKPENVGKVVSERILSVRFLPVEDRTVVIVGNTIGNLGFWDADSGGVYVYQPHLACVSGVSVHPFSVRKIFTSSYDRFIRLMDIEKGTLNKLCSSDYPLFSVCQSPYDVNSLYIGEGPGMVKVWDERGGKASSVWNLHADRINTIDFNPQNVNLLATSSTDGKACIWDLRSIRKNQPESLKSVSHHRSLHSAYFSPSGSHFAFTSADKKVGILSGANFDDISMLRHNDSGSKVSFFRAIWGWDDSCLFMGNTNKAVNVISTIGKTTASLWSPYATSIPCRLAAHPYKLGSLAGATSGGKVFLWTK